MDPMNIDPLVNAGPVVYGHAAIAVVTLVAGAVQLLSRKGTATHRILGWCWVILMAAVAISLRIWFSQ